MSPPIVSSPEISDFRCPRCGSNLEADAGEFLSLLKEISAKPTMLIVGGGAVGNGMDVLYADPDLRRRSFDVYPSSGICFLGRKADQPLDPKAIVDYYGGARTAV